MNPITKFYVSCNGNDENSGLHQSESFRTIQKAIDASYLVIGDVQIIIADGQYTNTNAIASGCRQGNLEIIGNISSPDKVVIDSGNDSGTTIPTTASTNSLVAASFILAPKLSFRHSTH